MTRPSFKKKITSYGLVVASGVQLYQDPPLPYWPLLVRDGIRGKLVSRLVAIDPRILPDC